MPQKECSLTAISGTEDVFYFQIQIDKEKKRIVIKYNDSIKSQLKTLKNGKEITLFERRMEEIKEFIAEEIMKE